MNIYQKLIEVRKSVPYLQKSADGPQFKYVSSSQVLANVKAKMDELSLLLIPKITNHNLLESTVQYDEKDKFGNVKPKRTTTYFTELDVEFTWINADEPSETIVCPFYGQGVDIAGEKGVGKALTYCEKYFMLKFFNIPTDKDDPDSFQDKHETNKEVEKAKTDVKTEIPKMLLYLCDNDVSRVPNALKHYSKFTSKDGKEVEGVTDVAKLGDKRMAATYGAIKTAYTKKMNEGGKV